MIVSVIVSVDSAGRILLPASTRKELRLRPGSKLLVTNLDDGGVALFPLDVEKMVRQIREDLKGIDIDAELAKVRAEINELAKRRYPEIAKHMARLR
jgi:AbrB family looped-hinge helix DNA binding protein